MHIHLMKQTSSLQLLQPNLGNAYQLLQDPRVKTVTGMSVLVFLRRFAPTHKISALDPQIIFRHLGVE